MSPQDRATAARAMAEAATHPRDRAAWRAAAALWERIAGPGDTLSLEPAARQLAALKRDVALATGPFQRPAPKAAPAPAARRPVAGTLDQIAGRRLEVPTIEF